MSSKRSSPALSLRQFEFTAACVAAAVAAHVAHLPVWFSALALFLILARVWQRQRSTSRVPLALKVSLILLAPVLVIIQFGNVFGREPGSALACLMLALKLLETDTQRDARTALAFSSFVLMSALLFDTTLVFTLLLFGALILLLAAMRELESFVSPKSLHQPDAETPQTALRYGVFALLVAIPLAACTFLFFPRLDSPLWHLPGDLTPRTGISDSMSPGSIQQLLVDDSAAFRVSFDGAVPQRSQLYWRGPVLTRFDGVTWTPRESGILDTNTRTIEISGTTTSYEITQEPTDKPWLFALDVPLDKPDDAWRNRDLSLQRLRPVTDLLRYRVRSALSYRLDLNLSDGQRRSALALPLDFNPRSIEQGKKWRATLNDDNAIVRAALDLFHKEFFYTLAPPQLGRDSIDDFLFSTKRGFCEHFASAFVVLMRAAGIPARVVTGYQGGYFNEVGNYLLLRQSDAHAWAEIWREGRGWMRVDPTASVSPQRIEVSAQAAAGETLAWYQTGWVLDVRNQFDLVNRGWNSLVVQFNSARQQNLLNAVGFDKANYTTLVALLIGSTGVLLLLMAAWIMRTPRVQVDPLDAAYEKLCAKLARAGFKRPPNEGPADFSKRLRVESLAADLGDTRLQRLLADYVNLRYASALATREAVAAFARGVRKLRVPRSAT